MGVWEYEEDDQRRQRRNIEHRGANYHTGSERSGYRQERETNYADNGRKRGRAG